jgi:hypothetical protein
VFYAPFVGLVVFDTSMLAQWDWNGSAWALVAPRLLQASVIYDPPSLAAGEGVTTTATVIGAALGDFAQASFSPDLQDSALNAWVSAADTVGVRLQNGTAGAVDLGSERCGHRSRRDSVGQTPGAPGPEGGANALATRPQGRRWRRLPSQPGSPPT